MEMGYSHLFEMSTFLEAFATPAGWGFILSLIVIEGLLSADNALVLAAIVNKLPEKQRRKALLYGLWGAYIFRIIAIGVGIYLVQIAWVKYIGAAYLLWIAIKHFWDKARSGGDDDEEGEEESSLQKLLAKTGLSLFVRTIITVELMDIAFSIDSILAAFAISPNPWILIAGGLLGILMMRLVATVILKLMEKIPELENAAFVLIFIIGVKMILSTAEVYEMSHGMFFVILVAVFAITFLINRIRVRKNAAQ
ncbi:TerC family protein [Saccharibacillus alkalitolerans]|uniref:TerC family protein n=1 Tax=Saccharibacillus alkalitolerans TaxID=2705290 RepID=A0ABX0F9R9_9BACL|nr:TerC family protein [Saccharibacillus alkalitolerans]NGZ77068.1 TerC family protein [Saccharibacillus alkalitolerans]